MPWLRYGSNLASVDANKKIVARNTATTGYPEDAATGATSATVAQVYPFSLRTNITLKNQGVFHLGNYRNDPTRTAANVPIRMSYFDHSPGGLVTRIMGAIGDASTADNAAAGSVASLTFSATCASNANCFTLYRADEDRIYFSEEAKIRYITTPTTPATSTLGTLFTGTGTLRNFIFNPTNTQVFYMKSDGKLYCHDLSSGKAWCNDASLGPGTSLPGIVTTGAANQFTWEDATHLLISTHNGYVYRYTLQP